MCAGKCNAKTKKIQISEALPSVMTKTLGKYEIFVECRYYYTRRKAIFKKTKYCFKNVCRVSTCVALGILFSFTESSTRRQGILKTKNI